MLSPSALAVTPPFYTQNLALGPPSPNPFSGDVRFQLDLRAQAHVQLDVLDLTGRITRRLAAADLAAGRHAVNWDGRDDLNRDVTPGVYFLRARTQERQISRVVRVIR